MRRRCLVAHGSIQFSASVNLSLKSPGRMRTILRLFTPQCPLEAQREGRDLRDQLADMANNRGNKPLSNFDFQGSTLAYSELKRFLAVQTNHTHHEQPLLFLGSPRWNWVQRNYDRSTRSFETHRNLERLRGEPLDSGVLNRAREHSPRLSIISEYILGWINGLTAWPP